MRGAAASGAAASRRLELPALIAVLRSVGTAAAAAMCVVALLALAPAVAHACPMCFNGGASNTRAFVWGSLFLMVVPTTAIGTLAYLAYRRITAIDDGVDRRHAAASSRAEEHAAAAAPAGPSANEDTALGGHAALRVVPPT